MANATFEQTNFTAGQLSQLLFGRKDISKFYNGVSKLENFIATKHGPIVRRPGTRYVASTKNAEKITRLVPFQFSTDQTYALEFGDQYIRFLRDRDQFMDDGSLSAAGTSSTPFELGTPYVEPATQPAISTASWTGGGASLNGNNLTWDSTKGVATITTSENPHGIEVGMAVKLSGFQATGPTPMEDVNDVHVVKSAPSTTTFTINLNEDPGTYAAAADEIEKPGLAEITFASAHTIPVGATIDVSGVNPAGYNGRHKIQLITGTTIRYFVLTDPGSYVNGGSVSVTDSGVDKFDYSQSADIVFISQAHVHNKELQRRTGFNITAAVWSGGQATFTISDDASPHGFQPQEEYSGIYSKIIVSGMTPAGYNGCFEIDSTTNSNVTVTMSNPGAATVFGTLEGWQVVDYLNRDGPYLDENIKQTGNNVTYDSTASPDTAESTGSIFSQTDIDRVFRIFDPGTQLAWGWGRIIWFDQISPQIVNVDPDPSGSNPPTNGVSEDTPRWRLGAWNTRDGWPWTVSFSQGRLVWGGSNSQPQTIWMSVVNDVDNFRPNGYGQVSGVDESVVADDAITRTIDSDRVNAFYWMLDTPKGLIIGTDGTEYLISQTSTAEPLSNTNIENRPQTFLGSKRYVKAVRAGNTAAVFVQKAGRKLIELLFSLDVDSFTARDLTVLSEDITKSGIVDVAYQQEPSPIVWCVLGNGTIAAATYEREQDVIAWHKHVIGGSLTGSDNPQVKRVAVISDTAGSEPVDLLWMIVRRTINGTDVEHIEFIEDQFDGSSDALEDAFFVDSGVTYDSTLTNTISGLDHLEGQTVSVLANGEDHANKVVSGGSITLDASYTKVHVGLPYTSKMATLPTAEMRQIQPETSVKVKRLERAQVLFNESFGVKFGVTAGTNSDISDSDLEPVEFESSDTVFTGLIEDMLIGSPYDRNQKFWIVQDGKYPTTVQAITIETEVHEIQG